MLSVTGFELTLVSHDNFSRNFSKFLENTTSIIFAIYFVSEKIAYVKLLCTCHLEIFIKILCGRLQAG